MDPLYLIHSNGTVGAITKLGRARPLVVRDLLCVLKRTTIPQTGSDAGSSEGTKMTEDMQLRGLAPRTQEAYAAALEHLAKYYRKSPDEIGEEELRQYLLYSENEKAVCASAMVVTLCGLKFLYQHTLQRERHLLDLVRPTEEKRLPAVPSVEEVARVLISVHSPRCRVCLTTIYACGLRLSEGVWQITTAAGGCCRRARAAKIATLLCSKLALNCCALTGEPVA